MKTVSVELAVPSRWDVFYLTLVGTDDKTESTCIIPEGTGVPTNEEMELAFRRCVDQMQRRRHPRTYTEDQIRKAFIASTFTLGQTLYGDCNPLIAELRKNA